MNWFDGKLVKNVLQFVSTLPQEVKVEPATTKLVLIHVQVQSSNHAKIISSKDSNIITNILHLFTLTHTTHKSN